MFQFNFRRNLQKFIEIRTHTGLRRRITAAHCTYEIHLNCLQKSVGSKASPPWGTGLSSFDLHCYSFAFLFNTRTSSGISSISPHLLHSLALAWANMEHLATLFLQVMTETRESSAFQSTRFNQRKPVTDYQNWTGTAGKWWSERYVELESINTRPEKRRVLSIVVQSPKFWKDNCHTIDTGTEWE